MPVSREQNDAPELPRRQVGVQALPHLEAAYSLECLLCSRSVAGAGIRGDGRVESPAQPLGGHGYLGWHGRIR